LYCQYFYAASDFAGINDSIRLLPIALLSHRVNLGVEQSGNYSPGIDVPFFFRPAYFPNRATILEKRGQAAFLDWGMQPAAIEARWYEPFLQRNRKLVHGFVPISRKCTPEEPLYYAGASAFCFVGRDKGYW